MSSTQGSSVNERDSASSSGEMNSVVNSLICEVFGQPEKGRAVVIRHEASGAVTADVWLDQVEANEPQEGPRA